MSHLVSYSQIISNLRRTAKEGLISLLNQKQLEDLAFKYFGCIDKETGLPGYQCPYSGKVYTNYEDIVLEHIIPVISKGGTVLFNCIPTSKEVNGTDQKGAKHLITWWIKSKYWDKDAPFRLEKIVNYMLDGYNSVFEEYTVEEIESSYQNIESDENILQEEDEVKVDKREAKKLLKQAKDNNIHSYLGFILDCINTLDTYNIDTTEIRNKLKSLEDKHIFEDIDRYQLYQNIVQKIIVSRIGDDNRSYLTYTLNIDINKLINSINLDKEEDIYNEINSRLNNIENLLKENNLSTIEYFKSLKDIEDIDIIYKTNISEQDINTFLENIKIGLDTKIEIFIKMLNKGNNAILRYGNNETLEGYPGISLYYFWNNYHPEIKTILFEQEKTNFEFEIARKTILDKYGVKTYEELIAKQELDLDTKIEIFIKMLNKGNSKILIQGNTETLEGYPSIKLSYFWMGHQDKIKAILFEQEKTNSEFEIARQTVLNYNGVNTYDELIAKQEINKSKKQLDLDTKIEIFIKMLNKGNSTILKWGNAETLEGYPGIPLSQFWNKHQTEIKTILFEQEKDNPEFEIARQTVLNYNGVNTYEELIAKQEINKSKMELNLDTKIEIFIKMLNKGNSNILKNGNKEILEGYPGISLSNFWSRYQTEIKTILFEQKKDNPEFEIARQTILKYFFIGNYQELEFKSNLYLRISCFIKMLNKGNKKILKSRNNEFFEGYPNIHVGQFWRQNKNREIIIQTLFNKLKDNSSFDTARGLILTNLKVDTIEEYYEKIEKESKKIKENNKIKKQLEETIKMVDEIYGLLNNDEEQRKRA